MSDKKKSYRTGSPRNSPSMVPFAFTQSERQEHFPYVQGDYYGFALVKDIKEVKAYLCADVVNDETISLHVWIPKENRSKDTIAWLKALLHTEVKDWAYSIDKPVITASCPLDYNKTKDLLDTFGFTLTPVWVGVLNEQEV